MLQQEKRRWHNAYQRVQIQELENYMFAVTDNSPV
jgi:hypothetical protein